VAYLGLFTYPAMQCSTFKNTTQQELFNIIKTPLGTDFLVYSLVHNITLLKCMCKDVFYAKKLSSHFPSVTSFIHPLWKENNVIIL